VNDRIARERAFHDARFADELAARPADRFYVINRASNAYFKRIIDAAPPGARALEIGCGDGAYAALHAASRGLSVTAVDVSGVAIQHARAEAERRGVAGRIEFSLMNAEELDLDTRSFDLVCGLGVLHHLDLQQALREASRVLSADGVAVFVEPLAHNPVLRAYRRLTPAQRTVDEQPLRAEDLETLQRHFAKTEIAYFHLLTMLALPLAGRPSFDPVIGRLEALDRLVFRTPLRRWAWMVGMRLTGPRAT
jgi:ubiquinone/menaquinone biosynthesis C-methylase UbiE